MYNFPVIICTVRRWWHGTLNCGLTTNWPVRPLKLPCRAAVWMPGSQSGQSIGVLMPVALFIMRDQVMRGRWGMVGKQQLGRKPLEETIHSSFDLAYMHRPFVGLRYRGHDLFFYNNLQKAHCVTAANCSN